MLLFSSDFTEDLKKQIDEASHELIICSAFVKNKAIQHLLESVSPTVSVKIICRWAKGDLVFGASDLEVFTWCQSKGYKFGVNPGLHAKLYSIDTQTIFLGSANLTHRGLSISGAGNIEIGTRLKPETADLKKLGMFIEQEVEWIDQALYEAMVFEVQMAKVSKDKEDQQEWSVEINKQLQKDVNYLWVHELLCTNPNDILMMDFDNNYSVHDFELLKLDLTSLDADTLKLRFIRSRLFAWVVSIVGYDNEMRFGLLTSHLHNALLDDQTPYRREVKGFVVILFDWFKFMPETFEVKKYNRSETVRMKK